MKQTAVEWYADKLYNGVSTEDEWWDVFEQAKVIEKLETIKAQIDILEQLWSRKGMIDTCFVEKQFR
jgi:hypothetical protein